MAYQFTDLNGKAAREYFHVPCFKAFVLELGKRRGSVQAD
jgi:hypothetical protein